MQKDWSFLFDPYYWIVVCTYLFSTDTNTISNYGSLDNWSIGSISSHDRQRKAHIRSVEEGKHAGIGQ